MPYVRRSLLFAAGIALLLLSPPAGAEETVTLRDFITQRFDAQEKAVAAALAAQERATAAAFSAANTAVTKAEAANKKRLDSVNEFRGQLKDQAAQFPTRGEIDAKLKAISDKVDLMATVQTQTQGRTEGAASLWTAIAGALGLVIGLAAAWRARPATTT